MSESSARSSVISEEAKARMLSLIECRLAELSVSSTLTPYDPRPLHEQRTSIYCPNEEGLYFSLEGVGEGDEGEAGLYKDELTVGEKSEETTRLERIMEKSKLKDLIIEKDNAAPLPKTKSQIARERREEREKTAGGDWYNLQAPQMTPELEQDLKLLQLRQHVDPKKFFKRQTTEAPKHFEVGKMVANPLDFYSDGRSKGKMKNHHFVDDLLEDQEFKQYAKKRYREIQNSRTGLKRRKSAGKPGAKGGQRNPKKRRTGTQ